MSKTAIHHRFSTGYKQTNLGPLPNTWKAVLLGDLFVFKNGLNKAKGFFGSGTPIVNYMDVFEHPGLRPGDLLGRVNLTPEEIRNFKVQKGDVFFTRTSETVEDIGVASVMLYEPHDTVFSGFVLRARPRDGQLDDHYKQYCFANRVVRSQIISNATYTTRALTNGRTLSTVWIAVPPIPEQRAIAEALSDVDGLINALDALIAKKRAIKQATMQQLLTGKTRLPGFSGAWIEKPLVDLALITMGQSPSSLFYNLRGEGLPLIQGNADIENRQTIERVWTTQASKRCDSGDLILTVRAPVGAVAIASKDACIGRGVCSLRPFEDSDFLFHALVYAEDRWQTLEQGSTFTAANSEQVGQFRLRVPANKDEQQAIASILSDMDAEITALEQRRDKTLAIKQGMMQQLLTGRVRLGMQ
ncbi:MAG: restriction endonuclease subunit S, partial [Candidatus Poribacteria bacterium]|nr:restriction endonuclease subunit S [Candidatus Poribacteria bacterium]